MCVYTQHTAVLGSEISGFYPLVPKLFTQDLAFARQVLLPLSYIPGLPTPVCMMHDLAMLFKLGLEFTVVLLPQPSEC